MRNRADPAELVGGSTRELPGEEWLTERLLARTPSASDGDGYRALLLDPAVSVWLRPAPLPLFDDAEALAILAADERHWADHGFGPWVLIERAEGTMVGRGGLRRIELDGSPAVELPWAIRADHWNRGLASEAVSAAVAWAQALGLPEVVALTTAENRVSRRVAEKGGFALHGETRHAGIPHLVYRRSLEGCPT
jgi:RimJ/RimL family protein N-acetyltransferase